MAVVETHRDPNPAFIFKAPHMDQRMLTFLSLGEIVSAESHCGCDTIRRRQGKTTQGMTLSECRKERNNFIALPRDLDSHQPEIHR